MSIETPSATHIQVENVSDYAQYFNQVAEAVARVGSVTFVSPNDGLSLSTQEQADLAHQMAHTVVFEHITEADAEHAVVAEAAGVLPPVHFESAPPIPITTAEAVIKPPVGKGPYRCETCDKVYPKWNQLQRHIRTHDDDKPFRCTVCNDSFNIEDNLKLHLATHPQNDNRQPTCPECGKTFTRTASLKAHIILHVKEENLMCAECGDEFSLQSQLDRHMKEHRQDQEGKRSYPCRQCTQEFPKLTLLREHMKQHYRIKSSLSHRSYKRNIDRSSFHHKCHHCGKSFQKPSQVLRHIRIHTGERPFDCKMCDKTFNQKGALQIHMTKHTGERPHICEFCSATFSQKGNLRAHIQRVHSLCKDADGPIFKCDDCSCVFRKLGSLNAHISRSHSESADLSTQIEVQPLADNDKVIHQIIELSVQSAAKDLNGEVECVNADILQQALENSGLPSVNIGGEQDENEDASGNIDSVPASLAQTITTMAVHDTATGCIKRHTIRKVNGVRWHQCTYCSKEFKKPSDLVRHIRIHTHEKPYKCNQCFRAFAVKSTLTAHQKTHLGIKEYKCEACNKMFSTLGSLRVHSRLHTGAKPFDCSQCERKFRTSAHLKSHVRSHFKDITLPKKPRKPVRKPSKPDIPLPEIALQEPILITDTGLIQQPSRNNLFNNYLTEITSDRPHKCTYCQRGFKKSSHLKQHVRSHTGEKPYECKLCHRSFVSSGVLKSHARTHTGVKAYKCAICDSAFTTSGSLKRHNSTHTEIRPFMCPYCQKTFKTSVNCKKHMKTHRHELAMQALQEGQSLQSQNIHEDSMVNNNEHEMDSDVLVSQPSNVSTIDSSQPEASTAAAALQESSMTAELRDFGEDDLTASTSTVLSQATISESLLEQVFSQQNLLGNQQNFAQLNAFSQSQMTLPNTQQLTNVIDITPLNASFASTLDSNPILTTSCSEPQLTPVQQQRHMNMQREIDEGKRSYKCTYCDKGFKKSSHLKQHIRSHTGEKPYKCTQCSRTFVSTGVLKAHMRTHTGVKDYRCQICHAAFTTNGSLTRHMIIHNNNTEMLKCPYCTETFRIYSVWRRHIKMHKEKLNEDDNDDDDDDEDDDEENNKDGNKDDIYSNGNRRNRPVVQISEEETNKLSKTGSQEEMTVSQRILIECTTEKDRVSEFRRNNQVSGRTPEVSEETDTYPKHPHECSQCPKSFKKPSDLVRHIRIHTGEKPFKCTICAKSFTVKSTLDSHMKTHEPGEKRFKCHVCTLPFSTKGSLKVHMRLHTGAKPFKCPHCDQRFRTSGHRKSHISSHFKPGTPKKRRIAKLATMDTAALLVAAAVEDSQRQQRQQQQEQQQQQQEQQQQQHSQEQVMSSIQNSVEMIQRLQSTSPLPGQMVSIDPAMITNQHGLVPLSLTVAGNEHLVSNDVVGGAIANGATAAGGNTTNGGGHVSESALAANVLQGLDGIQLQLSGNLGQSIQIMGLDPSLMSQTIQIDDTLLQQLQQGGLNFTLAPNFVSNAPTHIQLQHQGQTVVAPAGQEIPAGLPTGTTAQLLPNTIQIHPVTLNDQNIVMQPLTTITMAQNQGVVDQIHQAIHAAMMNGQESALGHQGNFIVTEAGDAQISVAGVGDVQDDGSSNIVEESENLETVHDAATTMMPPETNDNTGEENTTDECLDIFENKGKYICHLCPKTFSNASNLKEHITNIHENAKKHKRTPHLCTICDKSFQKPSQLERHIRIHTGERPFKCPKCMKRFNQKNALQIHLKQHSGEKPYKCIYCDLAFIQKGNLKTHIKRAHHVEMVQSMNLPSTIIPSMTLSADTIGTNDPVVTSTLSLDTSGGSSPKESGLDLADLFLGNSPVD